MNSKVTAISVFYNRAELVAESVASLLDQTYSNYEVVLVDDGSTDGTLEELEKFADPRVRILHHGNMGFVRSVRRAIEESEGEFIAIHGSGDVSYRERIQKQAEYLERHPDVGLVSSHSEKIGLVTGKRVVAQPRNEELNLIEDSPLGHGEVMYRRDAYEKAGGYRAFFTYSQDYDLFLRMSEFTGIHIIQEVLYRKFSQPDGVSGVPHKRYLQCFYNEMAKDCAKARLSGEGDLVERFGNAAWIMRPTSTNGAKLAAPTVKMALIRGEPDVACDLAKRIFREALNLKSIVLVVYAHAARAFGFYRKS